MSWNGSTGLGMEFSEDCVIEDCSLMCNNYRHFNPYWHAGGMKLIPANVRCTVRRCEVAFNFGSCGIWVDGGWEGLANKAMRILDNVCHHNGTTGIFYEINGGGASSQATCASPTKASALTSRPTFLTPPPTNNPGSGSCTTP